MISSNHVYNLSGFIIYKIRSEMKKKGKDIEMQLINKESKEEKHEEK